MTVDQRFRITVTIPAWHRKLLILWAYFKGASPTGLAGSALQSRIEANQEQIHAMLEDRAKDLGLTVDELINEIIDSNNE